MMKLRKSFFFACEPCGQTGNDTPNCPPAGALICDNRYLTLAQAARGRVIIIAPGSNCQTFLTADEVGGRGFLFMGSDGQTYVEDAPQLTLPSFNPAVDSVFPAPGNFAAVLIANGADPKQWYFLNAPSAGTLSLVSESGVFRLKDTAGLSGQVAVCSNPTTVVKVALFGCLDTATVDDLGNPIFALRKMTPGHRRAVVGDIDSGTGVAGFKCIGSTEELMQEFGRFGQLRGGTYQQYDLVGPVDDAGGIMVQPLSGTGAILDAELLRFSPTFKKFVRAPARTKEVVALVADVAITQDGDYHAMGGHCKFTNIDFNFPDFFISANVRVENSAADYTAINFALFIDGVNVNTWNVGGGATDYSLSFLKKALTLGVHTVEIQASQDASAGGNFKVTRTNCCIFTVL